MPTPKASYPAFFRTATGDPHDPYGWQQRIAEPDPCHSQLIDIPTGLGKTAGVILAWLWNRTNEVPVGVPLVGVPASAGSGSVPSVGVPALAGSGLVPLTTYRADPRTSDTLKRELQLGGLQHPGLNPAEPHPWPRRLVYCLPMRTLVEQTADEVKKWLANLVHKDSPYRGHPDLQWLATHSPIILMGGSENDDAKNAWDIHPERPAIIIGTQDMLLSRALNRGYGMSRYRWPMHFGLLNNDCLWVLDETQLMGVGVRTSAQLEGLRQKLGLAASAYTWWASATIDTRLLATPDHSVSLPKLALDSTDQANAEVRRRIASVKRLSPLPLTLAADSGKALAPYIDQLALQIIEKHQSGTTTIVILNRVNRARELYTAFEKLSKTQRLPERILIHSRFRPMERGALSTLIKQPGERIIIATQAIEAGVDISSRTLITELAPWSSLVQRFGRCNRKGEYNDIGGADIFWIDLVPEDEKTADKLALPYLPEQLATARILLHEAAAAGASSDALRTIQTNEPLPDVHILRRRDLVDLFDTTADMAGLDIDVGRYIRDGEERDVQVFWRELETDKKPLEAIDPLREELVRAPLAEFKKFLEKNKPEKDKITIWHWHVVDGEWRAARPDQVSPGQLYLIASSIGGYSEKLGWTGEKSKEPFKILTNDDQPKAKPARDGQGRNDESENQVQFQTIEEHTAHVVQACSEKLHALSVEDPWLGTLITAAEWHDVGKAHRCFQSFITSDRTIPDDRKAYFIAKAPWKTGVKQERPHFRHELASMLAWLQAGKQVAELERSLVAYLILSHHGKVRLSIRSMPGEVAPTSESEPLYARGIWEGDLLPGDSTKVLSTPGFPSSAITLDLSCMLMGEHNGQPSWTTRALTLRDEPQLGIFRLAWLETILRAADAVGSQR